MGALRHSRCLVWRVVGAVPLCVAVLVAPRKGEERGGGTGAPFVGCVECGVCFKLLTPESAG